MDAVPTAFHSFSDGSANSGLPLPRTHPSRGLSSACVDGPRANSASSPAPFLHRSLSFSGPFPFPVPAPRLLQPFSISSPFPSPAPLNLQPLYFSSPSPSPAPLLWRKVGSDRRWPLFSSQYSNPITVLEAASSRTGLKIDLAEDET